MCPHSFTNSDYNTIICMVCGHEEACSLVQSSGYTENMPLDIGYSRYNRMWNLLKQLFEPTLYGNPNSRVVHEVMSQNFENGSELLHWLSKLPVKNKRYQNAHYYYLFNKPYTVPDPPSKTTVLAMLSVFTKLEQRFDAWSHPYKSFFSYNWLLRRLLTDFELEVYLQFVKQIKCKKRVDLYETMYTYFMTSDNVVTNEDVFQRNRTQPCVSQDGDHSSPLVLRCFLNRLARIGLDR